MDNCTEYAKGSVEIARCNTSSSVKYLILVLFIGKPPGLKTKSDLLPCGHMNRGDYAPHLGTILTLSVAIIWKPSVVMPVRVASTLSWSNDSSWVLK